MLSRRRTQIAVGFLLLAAWLLGLGLATGRESVLRNQPHVVVDVSNVEGIVQVSVDCEQAASVGTGEAREVDLGRLPLEERVYISVISRDHHPAWDLEIRRNDEVVFEEQRGHLKAPQAPATEADAVVFAKVVTSGGRPLPDMGCQSPGVVSKADVPGYVQSLDDGKVAEVKAEGSSFQPRHFPYAQIDASGRWSLPTLAVLGIVSAVGTPPIRRLAWSHKGTLATGALAVLGAGALQIASLPTMLTVAGVALLFAVASLLVVGEARTRCCWRRLSEPGRRSRRS